MIHCIHRRWNPSSLCEISRLIHWINLAEIYSFQANFIMHIMNYDANFQNLGRIFRYRASNANLYAYLLFILDIFYKTHPNVYTV